MKLKKIVLFLFCALFLWGCDNATNLFPNTTPTRTDYVEKSESGYSSQQQVSYSGSATIESKAYEKDYERFLQSVEAVKGKVTSQSSTQYSDEMSRSVLNQTSITVDVPQEQLQEFIQTIKKDYKVANFSLSSQDQTDTINQDQERLEEVKAEIADLEKKLAEENLPSAEKIAYQDNLRELKAEQRNLEASLNQTQDSVKYSTLDISLKEVKRYYNEKPSVADYFVQAFSGFFTFAIPLFAWSLISLFFVIPYLFVAVFTYVFARKMVNKFVHKGHAPTKVYIKEIPSIQADKNADTRDETIDSVIDRK